MALFKAKALLNEKPRLVDIQLGHIIENDKELPVILTLNMTKKLRQVYKEAEEDYHQSPRIPIVSRKDQHKKHYAKVVDDPVSFCLAILEEGYHDSQNIVDEPSKEALFAAVRQTPGFARKLAERLYIFFEGDEQVEALEDREKN